MAETIKSPGRIQDRYKGCLLGLACGDAVGTTVEFRSRGSFPAVTDMVGGGPFYLQTGEWTDDTSMALCLAESLFARADSFRDAVLLAANLGQDADTTAAICGQFAGACYGESGIPVEWLDKLVMRREISDMADGLYQTARNRIDNGSNC